MYQNNKDEEEFTGQTKDWDYNGKTGFGEEDLV